MSQAFDPTPEQEAIIGYSSHAVAIARPGSGKTYVVTEKIRKALPILKEHQGVIAISYTNKASDEIKRRVRRSGVSFAGSFFGTIDKFCDSEIILPFLPQLWGRPQNPVSVVKIKDLPEDEQAQFSEVKANQVGSEVLAAHISTVRSYFLKGQLLLEMNGALALFTIRESAACRRYLKARYKQVYVDEYQDSGLEQHELFLALKELGMVAVAVGDIDQAIFGFSGKDSKFLAALAKMGDFKTFPITLNHRCHRSIINYSLRLLDENCELLSIDAIHIYEACIAGTQTELGLWLGQKIEHIARFFDVPKMSEIAVLARATRTAELVDIALPTKHRYLRSHPLEEHSDVSARLFARLLSYHFNDRTTAQEIIDEFGGRGLTASDSRECRKRIKTLNQADLPDAQAFVDVAEILWPQANHDAALEILNEALLEPKLAAWFVEPADDEVQVMTLHKSKGAEFDIVFHLDMLEWVLPSKRPGGENEDNFDNPEYPTWDEDLHLHYVGVTRARKCAVLCHSTRRINSQGQNKQGKPSEFLGLPNIKELRLPIDGILP